MLDVLQDQIRKQVSEIIAETFGIHLDGIVVNIPPQVQFGDLALPVAFELARSLQQHTGEKQPPRKLAEAIAEKLGGMEGITKIEVAGPGYINLFLDRAMFLIGLTQPEKGPEPTGGKIIVEHTSVNPNKAAHIGHLRNAVIGDTLVRLLRSAGEKVEVHNYIDNTGVQVADVVVGFRYLEKKSLDEVKQIESRFDHYCWDLYARVTNWYTEEPMGAERRRETLTELEHGHSPTAEMAEYISLRVLNCQLDTIERLNIRYDLLPRESEILRLRFWDHAFDILKAADLVYYETQGKNKGCWVMRAAEPTGELSSQEAHNQNEEYEAAKILVRSDGTVVYTAKDIAYHLWKLGQLGVDFNYKPLRVYPDGHTTWITTSEPVEHTRMTRPIFGFGSAYLSVIGSEQSYLQKFVKQAVAALVGDQRVGRSAHVAYEKVALTPKACLDLGIELSPDELARHQISMSGRRGLGVKADDLIGKLEEKATEEVKQRHPELNPDDSRRIGQTIAIGALRYFLLKYSRTTLIAFDFNEALSFEGETGPYIQYAVVRANSIFRKLEEAGIARLHLDQIDQTGITHILGGENGDELWALAYLSSRLNEFVRQACENHEPAIVAKYAFQLAQRFNNFYHSYHILSEADPVRREVYATITDVVRQQLVEALELMGIETPEVM